MKALTCPHHRALFAVTRIASPSIARNHPSQNRVPADTLFSFRPGSTAGAPKNGSNRLSARPEAMI
ncbi:hypothetical protein TMES_13845 [Thalassospira mesophila]|uniref:Uncharacterized protein n=1 Tax=Thalassospira mesophila TaxID=1293891 RepID=A0A1Y2L123_9PROT|nr:hypothetical protein TMES_13845 [Thalassospira mesophila]